jgi:hypothetical protein
MRMVIVVASALALLDVQDPGVATGRCDELVVLGRVQSQTFLGEDPTDQAPIKDGIWRLRIRVNPVLAGTETRKEISARIVVHTYLRRNRDFRFALIQRPDGTYEVDQSGNACSSGP